MLAVDAGDTLVPTVPPEGVAIGAADRARAELILASHARMGYAALAVGERELVLGETWLKDAASRAGLPLVASNLRNSEGLHPFDERRVVRVGPRVVGLFAEVAGGVYARLGYRLDDPIADATRQVRALRAGGANVVVGLLHLPLPEAIALAAKVLDLDVAVVAHEGRMDPPQLAGSAVVLASGDRGRSVGRAVFRLDGKGPLVDLSDTLRAVEELKHQDEFVAQAEKEASAEQDPQRTVVLRARVASMERQAALMRQRVAATAPASARSFAGALVTLDEQQASDPTLQAEVDAHVARWGKPASAH